MAKEHAKIKAELRSQEFVMQLGNAPSVKRVFVSQSRAHTKKKLSCEPSYEITDHLLWIFLDDFDAKRVEILTLNFAIQVSTFFHSIKHFIDDSLIDRHEKMPRSTA